MIRERDFSAPYKCKTHLVSRTKSAPTRRASHLVRHDAPTTTTTTTTTTTRTTRLCRRPGDGQRAPPRRIRIVTVRALNHLESYLYLTFERRYLKYFITFRILDFRRCEHPRGENFQICPLGCENFQITCHSWVNNPPMRYYYSA